MNMECDACGHAPECDACPACGQAVPLWARFCPHCGAKLERPEVTAVENGNGERRLCRDESCIGIIGSDGRCTECGKPA